MAKVITLGPFAGHSFTPSYQLQAFRNGNPAKPIGAHKLDLRSVTTIQTSKNMQDLAGTFQITLKDRRAFREIREMDVFRIRLAGHRSPTLTTVMRGVVDKVSPGGAADVSGSENHVTITGRCAGKYLQVASLFLPVWDPDGALPTALTFGLGDVTQKGSPTYKAGGTRPYDIWQYVVNNYLFGDKDLVGTSAIPSSKHWIRPRVRFAKNIGLNIPFLQFDEDSLATVLQSMQIIGFTETWVDEIGRVVYRKPQWDQPVRFTVPIGNLTDWDLPREDSNTATYVEVIPVGDPAVGSSVAQALRAGRAPVPSSYVKAGGKQTELGKFVSQEFIIDTDKAGKPTTKGRTNPWWQRQRRLGLRPQQIESALLVTQEQAQAQAEGLLRFYSRMDKSMMLTFPGCPEVRLGYSLRCHGDLEGEAFDRAGYIEQVAHSYTETSEGGSYTTSITCTHGRDARDPFTGRPDPKWGAITLPKYDPADLADSGGGGVLDDSSSRVQRMEREMSRMIGRDQPYTWAGGHGAQPSEDGPWDCSGAVSQLTAFLGLTSGTRTSGQYETVGKPGRGNVFTVYCNSGHVFVHMEVGTHAGEDWGTTRRGVTEGGSLAWHTHTKDGFVARHFDGW